ncbi:hypothetical protein B0F90DRAFT_1684049 [Multifurca ochricompacta]|uniref:Mediator of RNA polymerase II transcription subunit 20 n=1 Tax=Multifurca ochricompacta TaxID=376703 RepID=A0AAD4MC93_9AGAM|nr:hypothetical protein B0F90DRAFT_1684049 [Multifurca ochricompacta]
MGITGLARWTNAPANGLKLIDDNIRQNHNGQIRGKWQLSARSYRSTLGAMNGTGSSLERSMCLLTMSDNVFVSLEDPYAPTRADLAYHASQSQTAIVEPTHYRNTFLTLSPPGALEQLLTLLRARWISTRQPAGNPTQYKQTAAQLTVEGNVYAIGTDWIVRAGNVILAGGSVKGLLLEAEYLPVPTMSAQESGGSSELLSSLLLSVLPNVPDARTEAVTISDDQWEDVLWDREADEQRNVVQENVGSTQEDAHFVFPEGDAPGHSRNDWTGVDRDRRSAYLIIGALRSDGLI